MCEVRPLDRGYRQRSKDPKIQRANKRIIFHLFHEELTILKMEEVVHNGTCVQVHNTITDINGRVHSCSLVRRCFIDLYHHRHLCELDFYKIIDSLNGHQFYGMLPGMKRFFSVMSNSQVFWCTLVAETMQMYMLAFNFFDVTDSDDEEDSPTGVIELFDNEFPDNIGVFRNIGAYWDENDTDETLNTTQSSELTHFSICLLYTSPSPRDRQRSRMPSSA